LPLTLAAATVIGQLPAFWGAAVAATGIVLFSLATLSLSLEQAAAQQAQEGSRCCRPNGGKQENGKYNQNALDSTNRDESSNQNHHHHHQQQQQQQGQQQQQKNQNETLQVIASTMLLAAVLLTENFMVWVVSATFVPGQLAATAPPPLQDNGRWILQNYVFHGLTRLQVVGGLRRLWNVQWGLVACLGSSFFLLEIFPSSSSSSSSSAGSGHRPLYNKCTRAVLTLAAARAVRTISFLLTVVPSQSKSCYTNHNYPYPPPSDVWEWIWVGLLPASHGGCNDLIISGHATVTSTLACISVSVANDPLFTLSLWSMVFLDYTVEIYEGFHYSVDMWLGMILVSLLWRVLQSIENDNFATTTTTATTTATPRSSPCSRNVEPTFARLFTNQDVIDKQTIVLYSIPALIVYLQLTVLPEATAVFLIVIYCIMASVLYLGYARRQVDAVKHAVYQNHAQHVLICLLFLSLGVFL
jgi:PAP2 superfamily C-terminal